MELICYLQPGWAPLIRPAPATRPWMDATPEAFAYRCLPLNIANAHGWEVLSPCGFEAMWDGRSATDAVTIKLDDDAEPSRVPVSLFGQGVITFHIEGIFRTPPGWNLWIGGSPNRPKDAIQPLTGVIETDWSPFTFTMNWRFTRADHWVRFNALEPIGFLFPLPRGALDEFEPKLEPVSADPALADRFATWSQAREDFHAQMLENPPAVAADKWQKHYYRGVDVAGESLISDHRAKMRLSPFDTTKVPDAPKAPAQDAPSILQRQPPPPPPTLDQRKREWLMEAVERQRSLAPTASGIERRAGLSGEGFLQHYYAGHRPLILTGDMAGWPALARWTPDYLAQLLGVAPATLQAARVSLPEFDDAVLHALRADVGVLGRFLTQDLNQTLGEMTITPAGALTPLHYSPRNRLIAQATGRRKVRAVPASDVGRLYNRSRQHSEIPDLEAPDLDRFPRLQGVRVYDFILEPGEVLFLPFGWWHQAKTLAFSVTMTFTNFLWPNDPDLGHPEG